MKQNQDLIKQLHNEDYFDLKEIKGRGLCGLRYFIYTIGLCYGLDEDGYKGRYCFNHLYDAVLALKNWDGNNDPIGNWIKHKGVKGEYSNPINNTSKKFELEHLHFSINSQK